MDSLASVNIGGIVKNDSGIIAYGKSQFEKLGRHCASGIRHRMWLLAHIISKLLQRNPFGDGPNLEIYLRAENFDKLVEAVKQKVEISEDQSLNGTVMFNKPEVAKKAGHIVKIKVLKRS